MDGIIALIVLVVLLYINYNLASNVTRNMRNPKFRSLIISIANFTLVMLFIICLPMVGGYSYDSFSDVVEVIFSEDTAALPIVTILGFSVAIVYFSVGASSIQHNNRIKRKIEKYQQEILTLEKKIQSKQNVVHLVTLLDSCCGDMTDLANNPKIASITLTEQELQKKRRELSNLKEEMSQ